MKKGIKLALVTSLVSGISIFINKFAVNAIKPALVFTTVKNSGVALLVLAIIVMTKKWSQVSKLKKDELVKLGFIGIIGGSLPFYLFFEGLTQTAAINAALIHKTLVFWVALFSFKFLKEKLNAKQIIAVMILFVSNLVIGGFEGLKFSMGELMILGATMLWAVENVIAKKVLKTVDSQIVTGARMGLGSLVLLTISSVKHPGFLSDVSLDSTQIIWMGLTAVSLLAYVMSWYKALKIEKATTVSAVLVSSTIVTNILSAVFVTHNLTWQIVIQGLMIVLGVRLFVRGSGKIESQVAEV